MNKKIISGLIMVLFLVAYAIQGEEGKTLRLVYVVEITGFQTVYDFHPPYIWYGGSSLTIPVQTRLSDVHSFPLQDIYALGIDFSQNDPKAVFLLSRSHINGMDFVPSRNDDELYIVIQRLNNHEPNLSFGSALSERFFLYSISYQTVIEISLDDLMTGQNLCQPYNIQPYPSALTSLNTTKLYKGTEREAQQGLFGAYDWESWGEYIVGFGNTIGTSEDDSPLIFHDLRLYDQQGNTVSIFPHVKLVPNDLTGIATTLQVSPDGRFLMVSPHNFRGREDGFLDVNQRNVLLIYEIIESGASNANETMLLRIPREIDGTLETGAVVDIEKYVIDGSQMSAKITGFVVAQDPSDGEK